MKVLVTAGPTREFIDPVRFLSNRSTGKMGYAVAAAFCDLGHDVTLVSGPVALEAPLSVTLVPVISAADMLDAVVAQFAACDCVVMAAAVADWRPAEISQSKIKKGAGRISLSLEPTTDILGALSSAKKKQILAGFAAETGDPVSEARRKLQEKGLDIIFANDVSKADGGFEVDTNRIICISSGGREDEWPLLSKRDAGRKIAEIIEELYAQRNEQGNQA